jgi:hypothetical protein
MTVVVINADMSTIKAFRPEVSIRHLIAGGGGEPDLARSTRHHSEIGDRSDDVEIRGRYRNTSWASEMAQLFCQDQFIIYPKIARIYLDPDIRIRNKDHLDDLVFVLTHTAFWAGKVIGQFVPCAFSLLVMLMAAHHANVSIVHFVSP